jgi:hypothetical protein
MLEIYFNREDLYPWCRKVALRLITLNDHIDFENVKKRGKIKNYDLAKANFIIFEDDNGDNKILKVK